MVKDDLRLVIPNPHRGEIGPPCWHGFSSRLEWNEMSGSGADVSSSTGDKWSSTGRPAPRAAGERHWATPVEDAAARPR